MSEIIWPSPSAVRGVAAWQQSSSMSTLVSTCPVFPSLLGSQGEHQCVLLKIQVTSRLEPEVFLVPCLWFLPHAAISWLRLCYWKTSVSLAIQPVAFMGSAACLQLSAASVAPGCLAVVSVLGIRSPGPTARGLPSSQHGSLVFRVPRKCPWKTVWFPCGGGHRTRSSGRYLAYAGPQFCSPQE